MPETQLSPPDLRLMQSLAQEVMALRPELVNSDATVGELAWGWGKGHADLGSTWRHRPWFSGGDLAGWGWAFLPHQVMRSDGQTLEIATAGLTWQVHPDSAHLLDDILDWYDAEAADAVRQVTVQAAGATEMLVACLGAPAHTAARALYYDIGFRPFTRDLPHTTPR